MAVDHIRYDLLTQDALRSVVRHVLTDAAKSNRLPGEHHFYISFYTQADGVKISPRLREQYPDEITIILQHQFRDLIVREENFEVGLFFGGVMERLTVPFMAIKGFFDPSVQFGLQFETATTGEDAENSDTTAKVLSSGQAPSPVPQTTAPETAAQPAPALKVVENGSNDKEPGGAEVVRLDRFRKK